MGTNGIPLPSSTVDAEEQQKFPETWIKRQGEAARKKTRHWSLEPSKIKNLSLDPANL